MSELLRHSGGLRREDRKGYRQHRFVVPPGTGQLDIAFSYDRGQDFPHSLLTLSLFDPRGFRGAGHRYAPRQAVRLSAGEATPGFLAGPLPAGEWMVEVDIHCVIPRPDGDPNKYELSVVASPGSAEARPPVPGPEPPPASRGRGWYRGELHLHTTHSDGLWTTAEMADAARSRGLDFMVLTDHNTTSGIAELRRAVGPSTLVLPGIEITTYHGHCLAVGVDPWIDWRTGLDGRSIDDVARAVREAGGVFVVAHPDAAPDDVCTGCRWTHDDFDPALAHAVEVWGGLWDGPDEENEGCLALWRRWLNAGHRLTATGATDAHEWKHWEGPVPLTYVRADELSAPAILDGLRAGRTYVSSGPELLIRSGAPDPAGPHVEALSSGSSEAELRLVTGAGTCARAAVSGAGRVMAPAVRGWFAAELWDTARDVLLAVTSPLYVD